MCKKKKKEKEKAGLKLDIQKTKIRATTPSLHDEFMEKQ